MGSQWGGYGTHWDLLILFRTHQNPSRNHRLSFTLMLSLALIGSNLSAYITPMWDSLALNGTHWLSVGLICSHWDLLARSGTHQLLMGWV